MKFTKEQLNAALVDVQSEEEVAELSNLAEINYQEYLKTKYWKKVRKAMHKTIGRKCELCGSDMFIDVHHFNYGNVGKETLNDLACLCRSCHETIHAYGNTLFTGNFISNRKEFEKQIKIVKKIEKYFDNKEFLKIVPLTRQSSWEMEQLKKLYECEAEEIRVMFDKEVRDKLIFISTGSTGSTSCEFYTLNRFVWFILESNLLNQVGD